MQSLRETLRLAIQNRCIFQVNELLKSLPQEVQEEICQKEIDGEVQKRTALEAQKEEIEKTLREGNISSARTLLSLIPVKEQEDILLKVREDEAPTPYELRPVVREFLEGMLRPFILWNRVLSEDLSEIKDSLRYTGNADKVVYSEDDIHTAVKGVTNEIESSSREKDAKENDRIEETITFLNNILRGVKDAPAQLQQRGYWHPSPDYDYFLIRANHLPISSQKQEYTLLNLTKDAISAADEFQPVCRGVWQAMHPHITLWDTVRLNDLFKLKNFLGYTGNADKAVFSEADINSVIARSRKETDIKGNNIKEEIITFLMKILHGVGESSAQFWERFAKVTTRNPFPDYETLFISVQGKPSAFQRMISWAFKQACQYGGGDGRRDVIGTLERFFSLPPENRPDQASVGEGFWTILDTLNTPRNELYFNVVEWFLSRPKEVFPNQQDLFYALSRVTFLHTVHERASDKPLHRTYKEGDYALETFQKFVDLPSDRRLSQAHMNMYAGAGLMQAVQLRGVKQAHYFLNLTSDVESMEFAYRDALGICLREEDPSEWKALLKALEERLPPAIVSKLQARSSSEVDEYILQPLEKRVLDYLKQQLQGIPLLSFGGAFKKVEQWITEWFEEKKQQGIVPSVSQSSALKVIRIPLTWPSYEMILPRVVTFIKKCRPQGVHLWIQGFVIESCVAYEGQNSMSCVTGIVNRLLTGLRACDREINNLFAESEGALLMMTLFEEKWAFTADDKRKQNMALELIKQGLNEESLSFEAEEAFRKLAQQKQMEHGQQDNVSISSKIDEWAQMVASNYNDHLRHFVEKICIQRKPIAQNLTQRSENICNWKTEKNWPLLRIYGITSESTSEEVEKLFTCFADREIEASPCKEWIKEACRDTRQKCIKTIHETWRDLAALASGQSAEVEEKASSPRRLSFAVVEED